jgi:hypothetical protein
VEQDSHIPNLGLAIVEVVLEYFRDHEVVILLPLLSAHDLGQAKVRNLVDTIFDKNIL